MFGVVQLPKVTTENSKNWNKKDIGWIEINDGINPVQKVDVIETHENRGIFTGRYTVLKNNKDASLKVSYGYLGFAEFVLLF